MNIKFDITLDQDAFEDLQSEVLQTIRYEVRAVVRQAIHDNNALRAQAEGLVELAREALDDIVAEDLALDLL